MPNERKTKRGQRLSSLSLLVEHIQGGFWIYHHHKPLHPKWVLGWKLYTLITALNRGQLYECLDAKTLLLYHSSI